MPQFINLHVGGFGTNVGTECWRLYAEEQCMDPNGELRTKGTPALNSFFHEVQRNIYKPRAVLIDTNGAVRARLLRSEYRALFSDLFTLAQPKMDLQTFDDVVIYENLRKEAERCDQLAGVLLTNSSKGSTGSVIGVQLLYDIDDNFPKTSKISFTDYAFGQIDEVNAYYSAIYQSNTSELVDCDFCFDFDAISRFYLANYGQGSIQMLHADRLLAQAISAVTMYDRLSHSRVLCQLTENLRLTRILNHAVMMFSTDNDNRVSTWEMSRRLFKSENCLCSIEIGANEFLGCALNYRGVANKTAINEDIIKIKTLLPYSSLTAKARLTVDNIPAKPKKIDSTDFGSMNCSVTMLCNTPDIMDLWQGLSERVKNMRNSEVLLHNFRKETVDELVDKSVESLESLIQGYGNIDFRK
ncbi:hypothetical protein ACOME3_003880 [Neoechinorhynchus agilis]